MKQLPESNLPHHGHTLTLIRRTDRIGLFAAVWPGCSLPGFIVAKIRRRKAGERTMPDGKVVTFTECEYLPAESEYGAASWFFRCQDEASALFNRVHEAQTQRFTPSPLS